MRPAPRFTIPGLMVVVLVASLAFAALRTASATWAGGLYLFTHAVLLLALVAAVCRGPSERAWWLGFALFGLVYFRGVSSSGYWSPTLPTSALLHAMRPSGVKPPPNVEGESNGLFYGKVEYFWVVGHCLWSLVSATIGGLVAHSLFSAPVDRPAPLASGQEPQRAHTPMRWRRFAVAGVAGAAACAVLIGVAARSDPALWVGAVYLLTWAVLCIAALGFACGQGRWRMICLGAALLGLGYMVLNRGPDRFEEMSYAHLVADQFLDSLRPWLPPIVSGYPAPTATIAAENARIKRVLDQPVPLRFRDGVPLEGLLNSIETATQTPDGRQIMIYVDPVGLQEAEKTLQSTIQIDVHGPPLSATLRLALRQLGMTYYISDGLLNITAENNENVPFVVDYYLLLCHCVLALLAAALGALVVPLVSARASDRRSTTTPGMAT